MKKVLFCLAGLLIYNLVAAQSGQDWYKVYTGKIGNMDATLHLTKGGKTYSGYVWFSQNQWPMPLYYNVPEKQQDSTEMSAVNGPMSLVLKGILTSDGYKGSSQLMREGGAAKNSPFALAVSTDNIFTPFSYYYAQGTSNLPPQLKNQSVYSYKGGALWPVANNIYTAAIKKQVMDWLQVKTPVTDLSKWFIAERDRGIADWKKENMKMKPAEAAQMGLSLSVETENRIMVMYENERVISLANYRFDYTGGAHGNYTTTLINIDKKTGKNLLLQDVINAEGIKILPAILDRVARIQYGVKGNGPLDQNGFLVNKIPVSKNFYVTAVGLGFLYAPYEIKSFADGEVNLVVPFTALNTWLMAGYKK